MEIEKWKRPCLSSLGYCNELLKVLALAARSGFCVFPWKAGEQPPELALPGQFCSGCTDSLLFLFSLRLLPQQGSVCVLCLGIRALRCCQGKGGMSSGQERSHPPASYLGWVLLGRTPQLRFSLAVQGDLQGDAGEFVVPFVPQTRCGRAVGRRQRFRGAAASVGRRSPGAGLWEERPGSEPRPGRKGLCC